MVRKEERSHILPASEGSFVCRPDEQEKALSNATSTGTSAAIWRSLRNGGGQGEGFLHRGHSREPAGLYSPLEGGRRGLGGARSASLCPTKAALGVWERPGAGSVMFVLWEGFAAGETVPTRRAKIQARGVQPPQAGASQNDKDLLVQHLC